MKNILFTIAAVLAMPAVAWAQTEEVPKPPSMWENLFWTLLPILLIGVFIWIFFIRGIRRIQKTQIQEYRQHREGGGGAKWRCQVDLNNGDRRDGCSTICL